ncbi:alpha/beta fold hydrolase [Marinobacter sp. 71-i]|uniref:Alpha/beta fold hydrolase n=1 Tax=Marinobacter iranensis TaxID=2962607 RepID=A0ABT5YDL5_9GAMM|nr:alpha/beta fold hydrolase [Marinobacter iranensis]MDF0751788.1 alpha/beta fold hydrolase [Marinobacter iranensis]
MPKALFRIFPVMALALIAACTTSPVMYEPATTQLMPGGADDFGQYLADTRQHLTENLVAVPDFPRQQQIEWNMPFRVMPADHCKREQTRGILLVHGLSDSPFVFRDFARVLAEQCIEVRTVLLQGHGTRPGDMVSASADVWRQQVREHFNALADDVDIPFIGGFSLGGALATERALSKNTPRPAGLVVLAPAWELNGLKDYLWLASAARLFTDFVEEEAELNPVKYESFATNSAVQLSTVLDKVQALLSQYRQIDLPVLIAATEADSVINLEFLVNEFRTRFTNPDNRMLVFRDLREPWPENWRNDRIVSFNSYLPDDNILEFSHQSLAIAPNNELYGIGNPLNRCLEPNLISLDDCRQLEEQNLWFSAWHDTERPVLTSRLTYNPWFKETVQALVEFVRMQEKP